MFNKEIAIVCVTIQADILHMHHSCGGIIIVHHKYGNNDTSTFHGTEGAGVSFIGNKADVKASEGGIMALMLLRKFMAGKCCLK